MSTTGIRTKLRAKALAYTTPMLSGLLLSCSLGSPALKASSEARIKVGRAHYSSDADDPIRDACKKWSLTPTQVERFFMLSKRYPENPYSAFYQTPCSISGDIQAEGRAWKYEINGGGTATWISKGEVRYWGCAAKVCEPMILLLTDSMSGE